MQYVIVFSLVTAVTLLVVGVARLWRRYPHRDKKTGALRLPRTVAVLGYIMVAAGAVFLAGSITLFFNPSSTSASGAVSLVILSLVVEGIGGLLLLMYRNFFLLIDREGIAWRSVFGRAKELRYEDVTEARIYSNGIMSFLKLAAPSATLKINMTMFDLQPAVTALSGRDVWPAKQSVCVGPAWAPRRLAEQGVRGRHADRQLSTQPAPVLT